MGDIELQIDLPVDGDFAVVAHLGTMQSNGRVAVVVWLVFQQNAQGVYLGEQCGL